jgi:site-specific recombinase XerD
MTFQVIHSQDGGNARSRFRVIEQPAGREVEWVNRFLDRECVRRLADNTLRSYALDLLHFLRWWVGVNHTDTISESALSATVLLDYLRFQSGHHPQPAAATINRRVVVADRALKSEFPNAPAQFAPGFHQLYWKRSPMSVARPRQALSRLRVKAPKRVILPLSVDEVARFWSSFRTSRDLAIVGLMLLQGLRSKEVLSLNRDDLLLAESQIRVRGKGSKIRFLPLAPETVELLDHYLRLERPAITDTAVFVSLKGRARGTRMTPEGLRSLFRHHRVTTGVVHANPHRFRHTFASDMIRAGVSLPALMQLMGHSQIQTTLVYVQLTPLDVYQQYARAVKQHVRPTLPPEP